MKHDRAKKAGQMVNQKIKNKISLIFFFSFSFGSWKEPNFRFNVAVADVDAEPDVSVRHTKWVWRNFYFGLKMRTRGKRINKTRVVYTVCYGMVSCPVKEQHMCSFCEKPKT